MNYAGWYRRLRTGNKCRVCWLRFGFLRCRNMSVQSPSNTTTGTLSCSSNCGTVASSRNIPSAFRMSGGRRSKSPRSIPFNAEDIHLADRSPATVTLSPKRRLGAITTSTSRPVTLLKRTATSPSRNTDASAPVTITSRRFLTSRAGNFLACFLNSSRKVLTRPTPFSVCAKPS